MTKTSIKRETVHFGSATGNPKLVDVANSVP